MKKLSSPWGTPRADTFAYTYIGPKLNRRYRLPRLLTYVLAGVAVISTCRLAYMIFGPEEPHPIDVLIQRGQEAFEQLLSAQTDTIVEAASAYRERRGRHPPPRFDKWHAFAKKHNTFIVEEFWDQIYEDLAPFWSVQPELLRNYSRGSDDKHQFHFRNGEVIKGTGQMWMDVWHAMLEGIASDMPDLDIAMNTRDEPRVMVPWETVDGARKRGQPPELPFPDTVFQSFAGGYPDPDEAWESKLEFINDNEHAVPMWAMFQAACPPNSPARSHQLDLTLDPPQLMASQPPAHTYQGFVSNWSIATNPCYHPHIGGLHATFVRPLRRATTSQLIPFFSTAKHAGNSDILFPAAMYYARYNIFEAPAEEINNTEWSSKKDAIVWRGTASGGINTGDNWWRFQRHRFLSMVNSTTIEHAEECPQTNPRFIPEEGKPVSTYCNPLSHHSIDSKDSVPEPPVPLYSLPNPAAYPLSIPHASHDNLAAWASTWKGSTGFNDINCGSAMSPGSQTCPYNARYFHQVEGMNLTMQVNGYKYLPDIDGNSFSGRYRQWLLSDSVPMKATIFKEWHDKRLVPWVHFVPLDNTFIDFYAVMEYFVGDGLGPYGQHPDRHWESIERTEGDGFKGWLWRRMGWQRGQAWGLKKGSLGHDSAAEKIAKVGKSWAEKVLRREDMQVYAYRLLLEWARLCDPERARLGWVDDIIVE